MKYIKKYDDVNYSKPEVGDYILIKSGSKFEDVENFIDYNIGKIVKLNEFLVHVVYKDVPSIIRSYFLDNIYDFSDEYEYLYDFYLWKIVAFSKNKEDLELILNSNKYNM